MKSGERIIPFSKKDKRRLRRLFWKHVAIYGAILAIMLLAAAVFLSTGQHRSYTIPAMGFTLLFAVIAVLNPFRKRFRTIVRIGRDLVYGKKRVIFGQVEMSSFRDDPSAALPEQIYDIGPYRFELGQLSPLLRRFREVMPGQTVEVHQCLHSGFILKFEVPE